METFNIDSIIESIDDRCGANAPPWERTEVVESVFGKEFIRRLYFLPLNEQRRCNDDLTIEFWAQAEFLDSRGGLRALKIVVPVYEFQLSTDEPELCVNWDAAYEDAYFEIVCLSPAN